MYDWENPAVFGRNKEAPHCTYIPYLDKRKALKGDPSDSPFYLLLDGLWKFNWEKKPADRPVDFYKEDYDVIKHNQNNVVNGSNSNYRQMFDIAQVGLSSDLQYQLIQQYLDVSNFADYIITNFYYGN